MLFLDILMKSTKVGFVNAHQVVRLPYILAYKSTRVEYVKYNFFGPKSVQNYKFFKLQIITKKDLL